MDEPILNKTNERFTLYPIQHQDIFKMYKTSVACFWTPEEINLSKDLEDWNNKLTDNERHLFL